MKLFTPRKTLALVIAIGSLITLSAPAAATAATKSAPDESEASRAIAFLEENMARFQVPQELRPGLLEKALNGTALDADVPGVVPIVTETVTNEYGTFPITRYADGSFDSLGVSKEVTLPDGGTSMMGIQYCTVAGGAGGYSYTGCQVYHWTLWHNMYFSTNYSRASNFGAISWVGDRGFDSGNSCALESFGVTKASGNNTSPATADYYLACTDYVGMSFSRHLGLRVSGTGAWSVQDY